MALHLSIVSPEKSLFDGEVKSVLVPGTQGQFEILENHAAIISSLQNGEVVYENGAGKNALTIRSGFVEVTKNKVVVCVEL